MLQRSLRAALLVVGALSACTTSHVRLYEGPGRTAEQTATISMPEQLEVASVNGVEIEGASGMLTKGDKLLEVVPGRYDVLVYYRELWELGDQHEVLRSDPALFVVQAKAGHRYRIDFARPARFDEAQRLADDFRGWVQDLDTGERVPSRDSALSFRKGLIPAVTFDDTLVNAAEGDGESQIVSPLPPAAGESNGNAFAGPGANPATTRAVEPSGNARAVPAAGAQAAESPAPPGDWLSLMKGWWSESSAEERREFLRWVGEQR